MFEISFNVGLKNRDYLDFLYNGLKSEIKKSNAVVAHQFFDDRVFLSLACEDDYKVELKDKIDELLSQIFVFGFKHDYLKSRLYIYKENLLTKTLLSTMTIFDSDNDKKMIKKEFFDQQVGALDGFFNFRLKNVKEKWDEIINLANENSIVLSDESVCGEFLAFLIEALPKTNSCIKIEKDHEKVIFFKDGISLISKGLAIHKITPSANSLSKKNTGSNTVTEGEEVDFFKIRYSKNCYCTENNTTVNR